MTYNNELSDFSNHQIQKMYSRKSAMETILKIYSLLGFLVATFSLAYFALSFLEIKLTKDQLYALMTAGTGIALAILSRALLAYRKQNYTEIANKENSQNVAYQIIIVWSGFEEIAKKALDKYKIKYNKHSIRQVIDMLYTHKLINAVDLSILDEAMTLRNIIAHQEMEIPLEVIKRNIVSVEIITDKILFTLNSQ